MSNQHPFGFPFQPYDTQHAFMQSIHSMLDKTKCPSDCPSNSIIGIFESPTGTGKSLSLLAGVLSWYLSNLNNSNTSNYTDSIDGEDEPDWVKQHIMAKQQQQISINSTDNTDSNDSDDDDDDIDSILRKLQKQKQAAITSNDPFLVDVTTSSINSKPSHLNRTNNGHQQRSDKMVNGIPKVYYASRTHSQLSQIMHEFEKLSFTLDYKQANKGAHSSSHTSHSHTFPQFNAHSHASSHSHTSHLSNNLSTKRVSCIALGSRKQLCINPQVNKPFYSNLQVNDLCKESLSTQPNSTTTSQKRSKENHNNHSCRNGNSSSNSSISTNYSNRNTSNSSDTTNINSNACPYVIINDQSEEEKKQYVPHQFIQSIANKARDIEDLAQLGRLHGLCPYYGSRHAMQLDENVLVLLPYNLLLSAHSRRQLGIEVKDSILIIDEAHNLAEAINQLHGCELMLGELVMMNDAVGKYLSKYRSRLSVNSLLRIEQLKRILTSMVAVFNQYIQRHLEDFRADFTNNKSTSNEYRNDKPSSSVRSSSNSSTNNKPMSIVRSSSNSSTSNKHTNNQFMPSFSNSSGNTNHSSSTPALSVVLGLNELTWQCKADNVNAYQLDDFIEESRLCHKLNGFITHSEINGNDMTKPKDYSMAFSNVCKFIYSVLTASDSTGKVILTSPSINGTGTITSTDTGTITSTDTGIVSSSLPSSSLSSSHPASSHNVRIRYVCFHAGDHMADLWREQPRAIILAGGTLSPLSHFISSIIPPSLSYSIHHEDSLGSSHSTVHGLRSTVHGSHPNSTSPDIPSTVYSSHNTSHSTSPNIPSVSHGQLLVHCYQGSHVVPQKNVTTISLASYNSIPLSYTFESRNQPHVIQATGECLLQLLKSIPYGVVVFFASYGMLEGMTMGWRKSGLLQSIQSLKPLFIEQQETKHAMNAHKSSSQHANVQSKHTNTQQHSNTQHSLQSVTSIMTQYSDAIKASLNNNDTKGAVLFGVIGGRLSEGINFADEMGRAVIVIGMPFANAQEVEMQQRLICLKKLYSNKAQSSSIGTVNTTGSKTQSRGNAHPNRERAETQHSQ